jgi:hypothetical protein
LCVLHTWGQTLTLHPHIHYVVPGGGFSVHDRQWRSVAKSTFFLPVKVLSRGFRNLLTRFLREAWREGTLKLPERVLADSVALDLLLARSAVPDWVVYSKPPFGGPGQVLSHGACSASGFIHLSQSPSLIPIAVPNVAPARCASSNLSRQNDHRLRPRTSCDHRPSTVDLRQTARSRGLVQSVPLHIRVRSFSAAPAHSPLSPRSAFGTPFVRDNELPGEGRRLSPTRLHPES